jgi:hypothetical protein
VNFQTLKDATLSWLSARETMPNYTWLILAIATLLAVSLMALLRRSKTRLKTQLAANSELESRLAEISERFRPVLDVDAELQRLEAELKARQSSLSKSTDELASTKAELGTALQALALYREDLNSIEFGLYQRHFDFNDSQKFKTAIEEVRAEQKRLIKIGTAVIGNKEWKINGSEAKGAQMIKRLERLVLRAFNGEADSIMANASWNNAGRMVERLNASHSAINTLAQSYQIAISPEYLALKEKELRLTFEHQEKLRAEREEQRRIQTQMREEEKAQREIARALKEAADSEAEVSSAVQRVRQELKAANEQEKAKLQSRLELLESQLTEALALKQRAISRAQETRSGHIYVVSNIGSFGPNRFKIGMTRRLDPLERVKELSDASVPFEFDVHAVIYAEDAPALESEFHELFSQRRVNKVNERKEFFDVSIDEIEAVVLRKNAAIEVIKEPEAREYRETLAMAASSQRRPENAASDRSSDR